MAGGIDWFRWHHGSVADQKFILIAKKSGASVAEVIAVWACLLEAASAADQRGNFGAVDYEAMDCALGMQDGRAQAIHEAVVSRGLATPDGQICAWEKRQPKRERPDDDSSERVRRYKERVKQNGGEVGGYLRHNAYVMQRDGGRCVYCGTDENLCLDHMIPVVQGGDDEADNLAAACRACNSGKAGRTPEQARYSIKSEGALVDYEKAKSRHALVCHAKSRQVTPRGEERREEEPNTSLLAQAPAFPAENRQAEPPQLALVEAPRAKVRTVPDCPHQAILALWAECLPALPQHNPGMWNGTRADHLRARWRETAASEGWESESEGMAYMRRLFDFIGRSAFLTGRAKVGNDSRPPFVAELAWIVNPTNWAKVHEGKYHTT